jgi:electron transport complex protein RnfC
MQHATFKKGIHPSYFKSLSQSKKIEVMPIPESLEIPVIQHAGRPAQLLKQRGDELACGELICEASGKISAHLHSPVCGKVKKIVSKPLPGGRLADYLIIDVDVEASKKAEWKRSAGDSFSKEDVLTAIEKAGIVGMGGATFPTHVKFSPPPNAEIDTLIVNGAECEPYLTCDHRMMLEQTEAIIEGLTILQSAFSFKKVIIGIEDNKTDALSAFEQALGAEKDFSAELYALHVKYPQGAEKMLINACTGRRVPAGGLPFEVGVLVANVASIIAIQEAVTMGKPLIDRVLTVSGGGVKEPKNVRALIGTPFSALAEFCGGIDEGVAKIIAGGPMMGIAVPNLDYSVTKGSSGLLFLTEDDVPEEDPCIKCGRCVDVCPMNLMPLKLAAYAKANLWEEAKKLSVFDCFECGSCAYGCPAHIKLSAWIKYAKNYIRINNV